MSVSPSSHAHAASSPLATLLGSSPAKSTKKADNDADDIPAAKPTAPKLATSGPGQILDRKV